MVKLIHYIDINFFAKEKDITIEETLDKAEKENFLRKTLNDQMSLFVGDLPEKKLIKVQKIDPAGPFDEKLFIITVKIEKSVKIMLDRIKNILIENEKSISETIDEECFAYLRFDKKKFLETQKLILVTHGDCIHIKFKLAAYPAKKEKAIIAFEELIKTMKINK